MYVLITYKDDKNQMKNEVARVVTRLYSSSAANSIVGGRVWRIIKLIQAFMDLHVTCKNEEDPFQNEGARVVMKELPLQAYADFFVTLKGSKLHSL